MKNNDELRLHGLGVSPGIAIARLKIRLSGATDVPRYLIQDGDTEMEWSRLCIAVAAAKHELQRLIAKAASMPPAASEEICSILEVQLQMLGGSRLMRGVENRIKNQRQNAALALFEETAALITAFNAMADRYLASRAEDVRGLTRRVLRLLIETGNAHAAAENNDESSTPHILISDILTPGDTAALDTLKVRGFVTESGGADSHTAILARSMDMPAVLAVPDLLARCDDDDETIIDGNNGIVILRPSAATLAHYQKVSAQKLADKAALMQLRLLPSLTHDGVRIKLKCNIELPREVPLAVSSNCDGIGLLRTEFLYLNAGRLPDSETQFQHLASIVEAMEQKPVTIRTLDLGGEKLLNLSHGDEDAAEWQHQAAANPLLGLRAIRLCLAYPELFKAQLKAILRVAALGNVNILLPMVSQIGEVVATRRLLAECADDLRASGYVVPDRLPPLGVMIEIPAAALIADELAKYADFFAIGTNDLTMYTLAVDRADEQMVDYYQPGHPAIWQLIDLTVQAAAKRGINVSVCGEVAADPEVVENLLRRGIRELSVTPPSLGLVKQQIRRVSLRAENKTA
ncbi:MAG: phosphoenolpyruvate--protein phosphotransferase [Alphaproteobacteria bacterium]|nr:phosphoenolpyruvate--protein phosphotransferase [Alphaproteobacteria bacterium]